MHVRQFSAFLLFCLLSADIGAATVGDFALLDHTGRFHQLSYYGDQAAIVIYAHQLDADVVQQDRATLESTANTYDRGHVYFMLNPVDSRAELVDAATALVWPVLVDEAQLVAQALGITQVGETLVIDPVTRRVRYRGPAAGLAAVLAGGVTEEQAVAGPHIQYRGGEKAVSYSKDIVPILKQNCVPCHHDGAIGPWSMDSHAMVQGFSQMIREVVMTRRMPPGQIDTHLSRPIRDVAGLTSFEQQQLVHWINAGAPKDGDSDPLADLTFSNPKFTLGEPDLIYTIPPQEIPATGVLDYRYIPVHLNLDRDVWVRAMEFVPSDRQVVHHVIAYVSSPADKSMRTRQTGADRGESIAGFAPGRQPDQFWDNSGRLLKKGSNLLLQMHYTTSGRATVDATQVGIYLHEEPPQYVMSGGVAGQRRFLVPPGAQEYKLQGVMEIERDAYLYQMTPHMHYRGKYMAYSVEYPNGKRELLLSVPKYDFNWQFSYMLEEPAFLPAGSRLIAHGAMDNSARNPANPDPTKPVHFGLQTKHEMFFGFVTLRYEGETPASLMAAKDRDSGANAGQ